MTAAQILLSVFIVINVYTLLVMAYDKRKAIKSHGHARTPEGYLFFLAAAFGAMGVYLGMMLFRHKTRKWYFKVGIPLLIIQNSTTIYLLSTIFDI